MDQCSRPSPLSALTARTVPATGSASVALKASHEVHTYLQAECKGKLGELMGRVVENMKKSGVDTRDALNQVASRGQCIRRCHVE